MVRFSSIVGIVLAGYVFSQVWDHTLFLVAEELQAPPKELRPGEDFKFLLANTVKRPCDALISRQVSDGSGVIWSFDPVPVKYFEAGQRVEVERSIKLPGGIACGPATYQARVTFWCTPLQRFWPGSVQLAPRLFTVVGCPGNASQ